MKVDDMTVEKLTEYIKRLVKEKQTGKLTVFINDGGLKDVRLEIKVK